MSSFFDWPFSSGPRYRSRADPFNPFAGRSYGYSPFGGGEYDPDNYVTPSSRHCDCLSCRRQQYASPFGGSYLSRPTSKVGKRRGKTSGASPKCTSPQPEDADTSREDDSVTTTPSSAKEQCIPEVIEKEPNDSINQLTTETSDEIGNEKEPNSAEGTASHGVESKWKLEVLEHISKLSSEAEKLICLCESFRGEYKSKEYLNISESLMHILLKLDEVESQGDEQIREKRRDSIVKIQKGLSVLEANCQAVTESMQLEDTANPTNSAPEENIDSLQPLTEDVTQTNKCESDATVDAANTDKTTRVFPLIAADDKMSATDRTNPAKDECKGDVILKGADHVCTPTDNDVLEPEEDSLAKEEGRCLETSNNTDNMEL